MPIRMTAIACCLLLMGAPCGGDQPEPNCPTPDAGDLASLCQELYPHDAGPSDAGTTAPTDPTPQLGEHEMGTLHNMVLAYLKDQIDTQKIRMNGNYAQDAQVLKTAAAGYLCRAAIDDCDAINTGMTTLLNQITTALGDEQITDLDALNAFLYARFEARVATDELPGALFNQANAVLAAIGDVGKTPEQVLAQIDAMGSGQADSDAWRATRSVLRSSFRFWWAASEDQDGESRREWMEKACKADLTTLGGFGIAAAFGGVFSAGVVAATTAFNSAMATW